MYTDCVQRSASLYAFFNTIYVFFFPLGLLNLEDCSLLLSGWIMNVGYGLLLMIKEGGGVLIGKGIRRARRKGPVGVLG
jgi:hypothetical protein